jgi:NAD+ kinase
LATFQHIGILAHPLRPQTAPIAEAIGAYLRARGIDTWVHTHWEEHEVVAQVQSAEMVVAIGGDGAMLRAGRVCAPFRVPVLGVNMGQLGFLTEISGPTTWEEPLEGVLNGDYWVEKRMMIQAELLRDGDVLPVGDALNDVVIRGGMASRTIWLETYIDRDWTTTYHADALVIATATGSTAYALACGGPILPPELRNILIVPVAPHLSMERPIVLSEGAVVDVLPAPDNANELILWLDGVNMGMIQPEDRLRIQASQHISRFVRVRERNYFYRSLLDRLEPRLPVRAAPKQLQI